MVTMTWIACPAVTLTGDARVVPVNSSTIGGCKTAEVQALGALVSTLVGLAPGPAREQPVNTVATLWKLPALVAVNVPLRTRENGPKNELPKLNVVVRPATQPPELHKSFAGNPAREPRM